MARCVGFVKNALVTWVSARLSTVRLSSKRASCSILGKRRSSKDRGFQSVMQQSTYRAAYREGRAAATRIPMRSADGREEVKKPWIV